MRHFTSFLLALSTALPSGCYGADPKDPRLGLAGEIQPEGNASKGILKVLTFNTWLLRIDLGFATQDPSQHIDERITWMPLMMARTGADVIHLQEVWNPGLRRYLIENMKKAEFGGYRHSRFLNFDRRHSTPGAHRGAMFSNGLLILSKYPFEGVSSFDDQLMFSDFTRGDERFVTKGAIHAEIRIPGLGPADFYNFHAGALSVERDDRIGYSRVASQVEIHRKQVSELTDFVEETSLNPVVVVAGDLNIHPYRLGPQGYVTGHLDHAYAKILETDLALVNAYFEVNPSFHNPEPSWSDANGYTGGYFGDNPNEAVDHVFVNRQTCLVPIDWSLAFDEKIHSWVKHDDISDVEYPQYLSDHFGVLTTFQINPCTE